MKTLTRIFIACFLLTGFAITSYAQDDAGMQTAGKQKPKAIYQVGAAKIVVWENQRTDGTSWKNFVVEKVYKKNGEWRTSNSFDEGELLELKAALEKAISEETVKILKREDE